MPDTSSVLDANARAEIAMKIYDQVEEELRFANGKLRSGEDLKAIEKVLKKYHYKPEIRSYHYNEVSGRILIVGESMLRVSDIHTIVQNLAIPLERVDLNYLGYDTLKDHGGFGWLLHNTEYTDILLGPVPHKMPGLNGSSSMAAEIQAHQTDYPKLTVLKVAGSPKITKETLTDGLVKSELYKVLNNI